MKTHQSLAVCLFSSGGNGRRQKGFKLILLSAVFGIFINCTTNRDCGSITIQKAQSYNDDRGTMIDYYYVYDFDYSYQCWDSLLKAGMPLLNCDTSQSQLITFLAYSKSLSEEINGELNPSLDGAEYNDFVVMTLDYNKNLRAVSYVYFRYNEIIKSEFLKK